MSKISRRKFLFGLAASMGALGIGPLLAACSPQQGTPVQPSTTLPGSLPGATSLPPTMPASATVAPTQAQANGTSVPSDTPSPAPSPTTTTPPDLVVIRGGEPDAIIRRGIAALGGMDKFVPKGANVIIKPNICVAYHTYEYAATTNPWVVATLVTLCLEAGARSVKVMDFPFGGTAQEAYVKSGIAEQVKAAGGEMAFMPGFKYVQTDLPDGKDLRKVKIFDDVLKADVIINVPIAKHHSVAKLTLAMKNLMGVIQERGAIHYNFDQRLADINTRIRPTLNVLDAIRILTRNGPTGGNLDDVQKIDTVIMGQDIVAVDSYATSLFGMKPEDLPYLQKAADLGVGTTRLSDLRIEEISAAA